MRESESTGQAEPRKSEGGTKGSMPYGKSPLGRMIAEGWVSRFDPALASLASQDAR